MLSFVALALLCSLLQPAFAVTIDMEGLPDTGLDTSNWTTGVLPPLDDMWDLNDMQIAAKNVLSGKYYGQFDLFSLGASADSWCSIIPDRRSERVQYDEIDNALLPANVYLPAYQANLGIYSKVKINGFAFRDVSNLQTSYVAGYFIPSGVDLTFRTTILGYNFSYPFFIAPAAEAGHANKSAEASLASAAGKAGILYTVCFPGSYLELF
jgi:hypothetical protein